MDIYFFLVNSLHNCPNDSQILQTRLVKFLKDVLQQFSNIHSKLCQTFIQNLFWYSCSTFSNIHARLLQISFLTSVKYSFWPTSNIRFQLLQISMLNLKKIHFHLPVIIHGNYDALRAHFAAKVVKQVAGWTRWGQGRWQNRSDGRRQIFNHA